MNETFESRIRKVQKQKEEMLKKYGWMVDFVFPTKEGEMANIHTHGVEENFGHPDFQIVLPIPQDIAHNILVDLVERAKKGEKFVPEKRYNDIIMNFDVYFVDRTEDGRNVLRLVLPDQNGKFPGEVGCGPYYNKQLGFKICD